MLLIFFIVAWSAGGSLAQSAGSCQCLTTTGVNVRGSPCGSVIGSTGSPSCFTATGQSQSCSLNGVTYRFVGLNYGSTTGYIASNFLQSSSSGCSTSSSCVNYNRAAWGARDPTSSTSMSRPVPRVFIHHSAGPSCYSASSCASTVRGIQNFHMNSNGWSDIGYNFLVGEDGNVYEGRGWDRRGAHAGGWNSVSYGICVIGSFESQNPNSAAQQAVQNLIACGVSNGKISSSYSLHGHRNGVCTACPGQTFYNTIKTWPRFGGCLSGGCGC